MATGRPSKKNRYGLSPAAYTVWLASKQITGGYEDRALREEIVNSTMRAMIQSQREYLRAHRDQLERKLERMKQDRNWYVNSLRKRLAQFLYEDKVPPKDANLGKYISVEIECYFDSESDIERLAVDVQAAGLRKLITFKTDASIKPNGDSNGCDCGDEECADYHGDTSSDEERSLEIVITTTVGEYEPIRKLCDLLDKHGAQVNASCGLHVHFDYRHAKNYREVSRAANRVARAVAALKLMLPRSRRDNDFCSRAINKRDDHSRYAFVNTHAYDAHQTLEIRGHSGTVNADKIINWIEIIYNILNSKKRGLSRVKLSNPVEVAEVFELPTNLKAYMADRYKTFANSNAEEAA